MKKRLFYCLFVFLLSFAFFASCDAQKPQDSQGEDPVGEEGGNGDGNDGAVREDSLPTYGDNVVDYGAL